MTIKSLIPVMLCGGTGTRLWPLSRASYPKQYWALGGKGNERGDRHPKIQSGVSIYASSTVLGNITIGKNSTIAAGSLVLKDVDPNTTVAGIPAKVLST